MVNKEEPKFQARYNWTDKQEEEFIKKYFLTVSKESNLMSGFIGVYNLLKKQGHEFVVITARGGFLEEMKDDAIRLLDENNIKHFRIQTLADQIVYVALPLNKNESNEVVFKIGSTGILEFNNIKINYIKFNNNQSDNTLVDILLN